MTSDCFTTHRNESTCAEMMMPFGANDTVEQVCQGGNKLTIDTNEEPRKAESCNSSWNAGLTWITSLLGKSVT